MLQLAKRHTRAGSATLALFFLGVVRIAYRAWQQRRQQPGGARRTKLGAGSGRQKHRPLEAPEEDRTFHRQVAAALVWYQEGSRYSGKAGLLGESWGIQSYMILQDRLLHLFVMIFGSLGAIGEALLTTIFASVIFYMTAMDYFGKFWPFAAATVTLLFGIVLVWFSSMLQGSTARSSSRSGVLLSAVEALVTAGRNSKVPVLLHSVTCLPADQEDAVKQAMFRRVATTAQHGDGVQESFAVRGHLSLLLEVDTCEASIPDGGDLAGLIGAYVLESSSSSSSSSSSASVFNQGEGCKLHHYSLQPAPLRGPAAIAAAASPLSRFRDEVETEAKRVGGQLDKENSGIHMKVAKLADEAILRAVSLSDSAAASSSSSSSSASPWSYEEQYRGLDIETQEVAGARFPMVRARMVVQPAEMENLYPNIDDATLRQANFAREIFAFACSGAARQLSNPTKGHQTLLQSWTFDGGEQAPTATAAATSASFLHLTLKPSAIQPAADGVFLQAIRRAPLKDVEGERFTCSIVPAPESIAGSYMEQVEKIRAGQPSKQMNQPVWVMDIKPSIAAPGGLDVCCVSHMIPEVSYFIPTGMVRKALMHSACCGSAFVEMAATMRVPNPLKMQHFDVEEDLTETQVAGRSISISESLVEVLRDTSSPAPSPSSLGPSPSSSSVPAAARGGIPGTAKSSSVMPSKATPANGLAARKASADKGQPSNSSQHSSRDHHQYHKHHNDHNDHHNHHNHYNHYNHCNHHHHQLESSNGCHPHGAGGGHHQDEHHELY